ncbi:MAG TPA: PEGA domain-containing protein [Patescibacteria group bacterium]|nr:PEGA domain-containing protein [Patescibacteria group bacterium]
MLHNRTLVTLFSLLVIITGTILAIRWAQGYRPTRQGIVAGTGLLAANSFPNGASVFIDGSLRSASDTTLNLSPGTYAVEIAKDGYWSWNKKITIEKELVVQTNALLIPKNPSLTPVTITGAQYVTPSPDGQQLLFYTASASAAKNNGLFVSEMTDSPLTLSRGPRQITGPLTGWNLEKISILWSPGSDKVLLIGNGKSLLLDTNKFTDAATAVDVSATVPSLLATWQQELTLRNSQELAKFPKEIVDIASSSGSRSYISPDNRMLLYTVSIDTTLPDTVISSPPASSTQTQERKLHAGSTYVYDRQEDRNFLIARGALPIPTPTTPVIKKKGTKVAPTLIAATADPVITLRDHYTPLFVGLPQWLSDSRHLILRSENKISIIEYDATNEMPVYTGSYAGNFVYPWPNGSKLVILTNFNAAESAFFNLYAISLR